MEYLTREHPSDLASLLERLAGEMADSILRTGLLGRRAGALDSSLEKIPFSTCACGERFCVCFRDWESCDESPGCAKTEHGDAEEDHEGSLGGNVRRSDSDAVDAALKRLVD